jgi:putative Mg2+ transporter-C (MgtC) family protein
LTFQEVFVRLAVAVGVGALIGLDRELRHKPAGLRTMALVSLGSAVFVLTAIDSADGLSHDAASRAIQGIVTGVGFLGAGAILRGDTEVSVKGMTTAASIWLAAAGGIACGLAHWALVIIASGFGLLVLVLAPVERIIHNRRRTDQPDAVATSDIGEPR